MRCKIVVLVVVYNKSFSESKTLNSISKLKTKRDEFHVEIWNNGPKELDIIDIDFLTDAGVSHSICQDVSNVPLSKIYNSFVSRFDADSYVFFDDDSSINDRYFESALGNETDDISLPIVRENGCAYYPIVDGCVEVNVGEIINSHSVYSSMSGVVIGSKVLNRIVSTYGNYFDECFWLYGVDTSFFERCKEIKPQKRMMILSEIVHSLSNNALESPEIKKFREKERSTSEGAIFRRYRSTSKITKVTFSNIIFILLNRNVRSRFYFLKGLFSGKSCK